MIPQEASASQLLSLFALPAACMAAFVPHNSCTTCRPNSRCSRNDNDDEPRTTPASTCSCQPAWHPSRNALPGWHSNRLSAHTHEAVVHEQTSQHTMLGPKWQRSTLHPGGSKVRVHTPQRAKWVAGSPANSRCRPCMGGKTISSPGALVA